MDRSSKLAEIRLVSKYYPVANYSYPRKDSFTNAQPRERFAHERISLGSEGSAPGLIDDRSDSEFSADDDDYQYHAHASELWDKYWRAGYERRRKEDPALIHPKRSYPALIPSPQHRRQEQKPTLQYQQQSPPAWPLPSRYGDSRQQQQADALNQARTRKPAATYSAFPKPGRPVSPKPRPAPSSPSWTTSTSKAKQWAPQRPPRPDERLLTPCIPQVSPVRATFSVDGTHDPSQRRPLTPLDSQWVTEARPSTSMDYRCTSPDEATITPTVATTTFYSAGNRSAENLPASSNVVANSRRPRLAKLTAKSTPHMRLSQPTTPPLAPQSARETEPQSFFDDDSDTEDAGRSFFKFHKRSGSDDRRTQRSADTGPGKMEKRRRHRASTLPPPTEVRREGAHHSTSHSTSSSSSSTDAGRDPTTLWPQESTASSCTAAADNNKSRRKRTGNDFLFSRMLGRKNRN